MRELHRFTYASGNEPVFVDAEQVVAIQPHPTEHGKSVIVLENGAEIRVAESSEQCYAMLKQRNTPAKQDSRPARRPRLSRRRAQDGER